MPQIGDEELLQAIAGGDTNAFACLMRRHSRRLVAAAERVTKNGADAEEIVQEAFMKVWTLAGEWRPFGGAQFSTWLYRVVLNASLDRCRRKQGQPIDEAMELPDNAPDGFDQTAGNQRHALIVKALDTLSDKQREALGLYYFNDMTAPEAADFLGVSLSSFEALLFRGKAALAKVLTRWGVKSVGEMI